MPELTYRPAALADLDAIYDFIEPESPARALRFVEDILRRCLALRDHPWLGPARPDLGTDIRIFPLRGRIVVIYRVTPDAVQIVRVFHGGQDYGAIMRAGGHDDR